MSLPSTGAIAPTPRYVICASWTHIFDEDATRQVERITRWIYDREQEALVTLDIMREHKWRAATSIEILDVLDSLQNGNPECLEKPAEWEFDEVDTPPEWA